MTFIASVELKGSGVEHVADFVDHAVVPLGGAISKTTVLGVSVSTRRSSPEVRPWLRAEHVQVSGRALNSRISW